MAFNSSYTPMKLLGGHTFRVKSLSGAAVRRGALSGEEETRKARKSSGPQPAGPSGSGLSSVLFLWRVRAAAPRGPVTCGLHGSADTWKAMSGHRHTLAPDGHGAAPALSGASRVAYAVVPPKCGTTGDGLSPRSTASRLLPTGGC